MLSAQCSPAAVSTLIGRAGDHDDHGDRGDGFGARRPTRTCIGTPAWQLSGSSGLSGPLAPRSARALASEVNRRQNLEFEASGRSLSPYPNFYPSARHSHLLIILLELTVPHAATTSSLPVLELCFAHTLLLCIRRPCIYFFVSSHSKLGPSRNCRHKLYLRAQAHNLRVLVLALHGQAESMCLLSTNSVVWGPSQSVCILRLPVRGPVPTKSLRQSPQTPHTTARTSSPGRGRSRKAIKYNTILT